MRFRPIAVFVLAALVGTPAVADPEELCARIGNSDIVRPYDPALRPEFIRAFHVLFPKARGGQSEAMLKAEGVYRCMGGKLLACFIGANLPCAKFDASRTNAGAEAFCRSNPTAIDVPLFAAGHASEFAWRCRDGHAVIDGTNWKLDSRGFATELWTPLD